ncbi:chromosome partitioning protein ParA [Enterovibrio sp. FF113]|uniref:chromosome partitioning protein ParA n=1 Tax=Enterovibrio sp. FF113 TaxID=3230010 RepID=UPI00352C5F15
MSKTLFTIAIILSLMGCNHSTSNPNTRSTPPSNDAPPSSEPDTETDTDNKEEESTSSFSMELRAQPSVDDQLGLIYEHFDHTLDRTDSLTGTDANQDGIRDDIEEFLNMLEVEEPVRNALKQNARHVQDNLHYDFTEDTPENEDLAFEISKNYLKVIACEGFLGMPVRDMTNTSKTLVALTYNTKARTMAFLAYNRLLDGNYYKMLDDKEEYCE